MIELMTYIIRNHGCDLDTMNNVVLIKIIVDSTLCSIKRSV